MEELLMTMTEWEFIVICVLFLALVRAADENYKLRQRLGMSRDEPL